MCGSRPKCHNTAQTKQVADGFRYVKLARTCMAYCYALCSIWKRLNNLEIGDSQTSFAEFGFIMMFGPISYIITDQAQHRWQRCHIGFKDHWRIHVLLGINELMYTLWPFINNRCLFAYDDSYVCKRSINSKPFKAIDTGQSRSYTIRYNSTILTTSKCQSKFPIVSIMIENANIILFPQNYSLKSITMY